MQGIQTPAVNFQFLKDADAYVSFGLGGSLGGYEGCQLEKLAFPKNGIAN